MDHELLSSRCTEFAPVVRNFQLKFAQPSYFDEPFSEERSDSELVTFRRIECTLLLLLTLSGYH